MPDGDPTPAQTAAEPPAAALPLSRSRRDTRRFALLAVLVAGLTMLVAALLSTGDAASVGLTAVAGTVVAGVCAAAAAGAANVRLVGIFALIIGLACIISAFVPEVFAGPEIARLLAGAVMVGASALLLPRAPDVAPAVRI